MSNSSGNDSYVTWLASSVVVPCNNVINVVLMISNNQPSCFAAQTQNGSLCYTRNFKKIYSYTKVRYGGPGRSHIIKYKVLRAHRRKVQKQKIFYIYIIYIQSN